QVRVDVEIVLQWIAAAEQVAADRAPDLGDLHRVRQAGPVEIVLPGQEHLRLRLQLPERVRMDDAVAVDLERAAVVGLPGAAPLLEVERGVKTVFGHVAAGDKQESPPEASLMPPLPACRRPIPP